MIHPMTAFLAQAVAISLSGVMAPGPVTAATLAAGARRRHAGAWVAIGHGAVEFPLMGLILLGAGVVLTARWFRVGAGLAGGAILLLLMALMLRDLHRKGRAVQPKTELAVAAPLWTGLVVTGCNPYFLLWWATVGLAMATRALELGTMAFALFAAVHWLCDLVWLEALSLASHQGAGVLGPRVQQVIVAACAAVMGGFGLWFLWDAGWALAG